LIRSSDDFGDIPGFLNLRTTKLLLFREDSFDAATRVRRGRLYSTDDNQPQRWRPNVNVTGEPFTDWRELITFQTIPWKSITRNEHFRRTQLALGIQGAYGLWDVVLVERSAAGYDLLTLRAKSSFIPLPEATELAIAPERMNIVQGTIDSAIDAALRQAATATIDACRDAAVAAVAAWLEPQAREEDSFLKKDLGDLTKTLQNRTSTPPAIVIGTASSINRLHSRGKTNAQAQHGTRPNEEADGEAAISMLGLLLRELSKEAPALTSI
jgi:hypothetical protein